MESGDTIRRIAWTGRAALGAAALTIALSAYAAPVALRSYATDWNRETPAMTVAQKEQLIETVLDRWEGAALRFGADPRTWRDTLGLQLSMLPGSTLAELATAAPVDGFNGIVARVSESLRSAAEKRTVRTKALGETTTDLVFVPINPCRIADTRFGGGGFLSSGSPRDFIYANPPGGSFGSQGGSATNCGLVFAGGITPLPPRAIAATVTVVNASGPGNFVIYPAGTAPATTSVVNYTAGAVLANSTVIVGAQGGAADFTVALNGPAHTADMIVDAIGYYYAPAATELDCVQARNPLDAAGNVPAASSAIFDVACPAGYRLTGGGCNFFDPVTGTPAVPLNNAVILHQSYQPHDDVLGPLNRWVCHWTNSDTVTWRMQARAACCRIPGR
jgi:hypothetical protein